MKKRISNILFLGVVLLAFSSNIQAQNSPHEFSFSLGGGLSGSNYKKSSVINDAEKKIGGVIGLGYTYHINKSFGINTGVEYAMYNSALKFDEFSNSYYAVDNENENLTYSYAMKGTEEKHNLGYVQIPLMLQYIQPLGENYSFYVAGGGKVGFAAARKYKISVSELTSKGEYKAQNVVITDIPEEGFGTYTNLETDGTMDLNIACFASIEAGMKMKLNDKLSLYAGAYFDYSLTRINDKEKANRVYVRYDESNPGKPLVNSIVYSVYDTNQGRLKLVDKVNPIAIGIKARIGLNL